MQPAYMLSRAKDYEKRQKDNGRYTWHTFNRPGKGRSCRLHVKSHHQTTHQCAALGTHFLEGTLSQTKRRGRGTSTILSMWWETVSKLAGEYVYAYSWKDGEKGRGVIKSGHSRRRRREDVPRKLSHGIDLDHPVLAPPESSRDSR